MSNWFFSKGESQSTLGLMAYGSLILYMHGETVCACDKVMGAKYIMLAP